MVSSIYTFMCVLHSIIALTCGALMIFYSKEISVLGHRSETASKLQGTTPYDQLLIDTSDSFSGLLLFTIGFLLLMVAFVKDIDFQMWRFFFERKLGDLAHEWPRHAVGDIALAISWVFFLVYTWREKYD
ncbi:hypothetical protein AAZX31_17G165300 [Glycine max]|uniref:DUF7865 domain-containing protein n=1 Tax=Glycine max TaxID=3847 RepID=K7MM47_SOYBN|nr:hypothetical protein GYH30_047581 [Glycine max]KRH04594.1 hypothetical protein GLYMA_17G172300v4 [Glycine max]